MNRVWSYGCGVLACMASACSSNETMGSPMGAAGTDPDKAPQAIIDRFSDEAGHLQKRSASPSLPGPNEPVDFDQGPFITQGLGPDGEVVKYYNFDVQPTTPAPIFVPMRRGAPVPGQLNIVDVVPGDAGYNDFWQVVAVTVPESYVANSLTSADAVFAAGYPMQTTDTLVNCPIVPAGSTASLRDRDDTSAPGVTRGWYEGEVVHYFNFGEKAGGLVAVAGMVPTSPIWVTFNDDSTGPASGFKTETGTSQTHNVTGSLPTSAAYSPLWDVTPYPNAHFDDVNDAATAITAAGDGAVAAMVNCPIVSEPTR